MPEIKEVKLSTKTASRDSKSEDLHDDSIYIVKTRNKLRFIQRNTENPPTKSSNQVI